MVDEDLRRGGVPPQTDSLPPPKGAVPRTKDSVLLRYRNPFDSSFRWTTGNDLLVHSGVQAKLPRLLLHKENRTSA